MEQQRGLHYKIAAWMSKNFPRLKDNQTLTSIFDIFLVANSFIFHNSIYKDSIKFINTLKNYESVKTQKHKFGGIQFNLGEKEICHIHGNGIIDILCPEVIQKKYLVENGYCNLHHVQPKSKWTTFYLDGTNFNNALKYAEIHYKVIVMNDSFLDNNLNLKTKFNYGE
jgi:hypothetical protein